MQTIAALIERRADEDEERIFLRNLSSNRTVSYAQLHRAAAAWSRWLTERDVPSEAVVLISLADPVDFAVAYLGVLAAGRTAAPIDPRAPAAEQERLRTLLRPAAVITERTATELIRRSREAGSPTLAQLPPGRVRLATSGSTGRPKIVELREAQLLHVAAAVALHQHLTACDVGYNCLPLFHINAQVVALLATLTAGGELALEGRFAPSGFWDRLAEATITWINAVPAMLNILAREAPPRPWPQLRLVRSASAALSQQTREIIRESLGVALVESYGMTEAASQITATALDGADPEGSVGYPVGEQLQVRGADGRLASPGVNGRIWIRGTGVISRYADGRHSERFDADGWLDTGDVGHTDITGALFLSGRADEVINRGGELIYPQEIQEVLLADQRVREALVVGVPDEILGAVVVAKVVTDEASAGHQLIEALTHRCAQQLAPFKRPISIDVVANLPHNATGKIASARVRELLAAGQL